MAFIGFGLPPETIRILTEIDIPGERVDSRHLHTTLVCLESKVSVEDLAEVMKVTYEYVSKKRPFVMKTTRVDYFPATESSDNVYPIICPVESEELHDFCAGYKEALDKQGIEFKKNFPIYKPHVTLAYSEKKIKPFKIPPVVWGAHEVIIWGGDTGDQRLVVHLPMSLKDRVASRYKCANLM